MNDLPAPPTQGNNPAGTPVTQPVAAGGGISGKEKEAGVVPTEAPFRPVGQEEKLSPEVTSAGVRIQPTSIPIPPPVQQMGVQAAGQNVAPLAPAVNLPLSDDQIAQGLKQSIWSSWRWLAHWCVRKLKQVHLTIKNVQGRLTRVRQ